MAAAVGLLRELEKLRTVHGEEAASARKVELMEALARRRLTSAAAVQRLHEVLCFLAAYPDDERVLETARRLLGAFDARGDLRRRRGELADSGIAGTDTHYRFYWQTARWLARRWPGHLEINWPEFENRDRLTGLLHLLLPYSETPALDELDLGPAEWIERLEGPGETDGAFLVRRFDALAADDFVRETVFEELDVPFRLTAGADTPSRTRARYRRAGPVTYQRRPLDRSRPDLMVEMRKRPLAVRAVSRAEGRRLIDLAREAMVTRSRDLDAFANADPNDVRLVDFAEGLQFACFGALPERRLLLESVYGFLTLKNGVPIGYVLSSALFRSAGVAYNVFDTFRGGEAALVLGRVLAMVRHLFGARTFSIDPYQLGHHNQEGLRSGAWWFYYKLGFRPLDPEVRRILRGELAAMKRDPFHRSTLATLQRLSADHVFLHAGGKPGRDVIGRLPLGAIGERISRFLAEHHGSAREAGVRECSREAARLLGIRSLRGFSRGERLAWERWSPLVMVLPGVERWPAGERGALVRVIRAKGGRRESDFVPLFDGHTRLKRALLAL